MANHIEEYKYITGYNNKYYITSLGRVFITNYRGTGRMKEMKQRLICGYPSLGLEKDSENRVQKIHKIHRLVAEHFIPNPYNKPIVNHKDGNKRNNAVDNLEWVTSSENTVHAYANNLARNWWNKELGIVCILLIEVYKYNHADVAKLFNISRHNVSHFWNKGYKTFKLSHSNPFIPKHSKKLPIPESLEQYILKLLEDNSVLNRQSKECLSV